MMRTSLNHARGCSWLFLLPKGRRSTPLFRGGGVDPIQRPSGSGGLAGDGHLDLLTPSTTVDWMVFKFICSILLGWLIDFFCDRL